MTDGDALYSAIMAAPADQAPRLVYADWLDEHDGGVPCGICDGQGYQNWLAGTALSSCKACAGTGRVTNAEIAEFIRLQCRFDNLKIIPCVCQVRGNGTLVKRCANCEQLKKERTLIERLRPSTIEKIGRPSPHCHAWSLCRDDNRRVRQNGVFPPEPFREAFILIVIGGFVSKAILPMLAFTGGACPTCSQYTTDAERVCQRCMGKGNVPGLMNSLHKTFPITEIDLCDRIPTPIYRARPEYRHYYWLPSTNPYGDPRRQDTLSLDLYNQLVAPVLEESDVRGFSRAARGMGHPVTIRDGKLFGMKVYPTLEDAHQALSDAAVAIGRDSVAEKSRLWKRPDDSLRRILGWIPLS
jgi:uncharacterized protein (TIGR02996 family)